MTSITGGSTQILSEIHVLTKKLPKFSVFALEMPFYFCFLWKTKNLSKKWKMEELFRNCLRISTLWENTFLKQIRSTYRKKLKKMTSRRHPGACFLCTIEGTKLKTAVTSSLWGFGASKHHFWRLCFGSFPARFWWF